jgi:hypothetical protein
MVRYDSQFRNCSKKCLQKLDPGKIVLKSQLPVLGDARLLVTNEAMCDARHDSDSGIFNYKVRRMAQKDDNTKKKKKNPNKQTNYYYFYHTK